MSGQTVYAYVSNDPLGKIDPNGEWDACEHGATCAVLDFTGLWTASQALAADAAYLTAVLTNNVEVQNQVAQELADNKGDLYKTLAEFATGYGAGKVAAWAFDAWAASGAARGGATVIGKLGDLKNVAAGERTLLERFPNLGSPKANWAQNSSVLRKEMSLGQPIRDATVDASGRLINNTGFLRAERNLLETHGWTFDSATTRWMPPAP